MKRLLTGIQSSGTLHIGNYFGALKPFVDMAGDYDSTLMIADYHALTTLRDPAQLRTNIVNVAKDYLAAGINPKSAIIFKQSDVPEHMELSWIFQCLVTVPFLQQAHSYKDKVAKGLEANAGLFAYPMLMAADILLYDTDLVPVGQDQRQHIEYAREAAAKFNNAFCRTETITRGFNDPSKHSILAGNDIFKEPEGVILESVAVVPGTDGKKMSKSYGNTIPLFGTKDEISKAVMSIVTDSSGDRPENVYAIHRAFKTEAELEPLYEAHKGKYKALKDALVEDIEALVAPMRERRDSISDEDVRDVLADGGERARARAQEKMRAVRAAVGVTI